MKFNITGLILFTEEMMENFKFYAVMWTNS